MAVALVEVSPFVRDAVERASLEAIVYESWQALMCTEPAALPALDAVVLGEAMRDPIQAAKSAHRMNANLSVVILGADDQQTRRLRDALRFAPLLGGDIACAVTSVNATAEIEEAATRARARRRHRQTLAAIAPQVEALRIVARDREHYADQLTRLAPVGIITVDDESRIVTANPVAERIFGRAERNLIGLTIGGDELGHDGGAWRDLLDSARAEAGEAVVFSRSKAGGDCIIEARVVTILTESHRGYLVVMDDVTARAQLEQERRLAFERAEHASQLKNEFIATISHELRTPLNAIIGWAQLLKAGSVPSAQIDHAHDVIERNARAQSVLVADLLEVSTIVSGKMRLSVTPTNVTQVVESAIDTVTPAANAKRVRLERALATELPLIPADADRLQQVIWNLLSNAVKFTPPGGKVSVVLEQAGSVIELAVRDSGAGIAAEMLPFIFDAFRQADGSTTRAHGGLGLGLTIARRIVETHGGVITASSQGAGKGSVFTVRIPISVLSVNEADSEGVVESAHRVAQSSVAASHVLVHACVLVVDDDDDARDLLKITLELAGAQVKVAASVDAARRVLLESRPDLVISDIGMPLEDGFVLARHVRQLAGERIPMVALTAYATREDREKTLASGFDAHLAKPVESGLLIATAQMLIRNPP